MTTPTCVACENEPLTTPEMTGRRLCDDCAKLLGVVPMLPSQRPPNPCQRCDQRVFIRAIPRELDWAKGEYYEYQRHAPMSVTYDIVKSGRMFSSAKRVDDASAYA